MVAVPNPVATAVAFVLVGAFSVVAWLVGLALGLIGATWTDVEGDAS